MKRTAFLLLLSSALMIGQQPQPQPPPQPQTQPQEEEDGPGVGVARLSLMNGEVSVRRGDSGDLVAAAMNAPLVVTDRVLTGPSSRAEVQFDYSNFMRIGSESEVRFSELDNKRYQIQVAVGTTTFRILRQTDAQIEISTPSVSVRPMRVGVYRILVREDGSSEITVRSGEADIYSPTGSQMLRAGSTMMARGSASDPEFQVTAAVPLDEWDRWNDSRDRELLRSTSYEHVSPDITGAEDLEGQGQWVDEPGYGTVWAPTVSADWAPYRYGRWTWGDYYGWTWVSYDPWGWAPYHYGRWFYGGRGWCWWPGGRYSHHYYRPALVSFFGWGNGGGRGWGHVGWIPLAPHEAFHPWYGRGIYGGYRNGGIGNRTVIVNNSNVFSTYRNARYVSGVTSVRADQFGRGHIDGSNYTRVTRGDMERASLVRGQLPMSPGRDSVRYSDRSVRAGDLPRTSDNRQFFSRRPVAPTQRASFEQQRQAMDQVSRRTFGGGTGRVDQPSRAGESPAGGWRRAGEQPSAGRQPSYRPQEGVRTEQPRMSAPQRGGMSDPPRTAPSENGGWRRFGQPGGSGSGSERSAPSYRPPQSSPSYRSAPSENGNRGFGGSGRNSDSVRISPPIVRDRGGSSPSYSPPSRPSYSEPQRSNPSYSPPSRPSYSAPQRSSPSYSPPSRPSYSAPQRSSPSYSAPSRPSYSAPSRPSYSAPSAPRSSGGGGGGGSHSSGGGGSRSSGSGGHRGR